MKALLLALFTLFSINTHASPATKDFEEASRLWKDFRACEADVKNEVKLINCAESFIAPKVTRYEKGKLVSMLVMGFSFSDLHSCEGIKNLLPEMPNKEEKYFCMNVLGNTSKLPGYIVVTTVKGQMRLNAIRYSEKL